MFFYSLLYTILFFPFQIWAAKLHIKIGLTKFPEDIFSVGVVFTFNYTRIKLTAFAKNISKALVFNPSKENHNNKSIFSKKRHQEKLKKKAEKFCGFEKTPYLCTRNLKMEYKCKHHSIKNGPFVYRLGRQIFILERGVRFPYGLL